MVCVLSFVEQRIIERVNNSFPQFFLLIIIININYDDHHQIKARVFQNNFQYSNKQQRKRIGYGIFLINSIDCNDDDDD